MENKNKLLLTDIISSFGTGISDVAIITMAYMITKSPEKTAYIISLRLISSMLVFFLIPHLLRILSMRVLSILTDFARSVTCLTIVFTWNIYVLAISSTLITLCAGLNTTLKNVAFQKFVDSNERVTFVSKQQFYYNFFGLMAPIISSLAIGIFGIKFIFYVESFLFLMSTYVVSSLEEWTPENPSQKKSIFSGFTYIFNDKVQKNILFFRLSIITSMVAYEIISTYILTDNYKELINHINITYVSSYSAVVALFSSMSTFSLLVGSLIAGKIFKIESINKSFILGAVLISVGCLIWSVPLTKFLVLSYLSGTFIIYLGLSLLKISLYSSGQELTDKGKFTEIIATSDMLSRSYQSLLGFVIVAGIDHFTAEKCFLFLAFAALGSLFFSSSIYKPLILRKVKDG